MIWGRSERKLPLVGVDVAGKTYFLVSLGYYVSRKGWGRVAGEEGSVYVDDLMPHVLRREPIPPTAGNYPVKIEVDTVDYMGNDGSPMEYDANLTISTQDFSGGEFEAAMEQLTVGAGFEGSAAEAFREVYAGADGLVVVVDLVRGADPDTFENDRSDLVRSALSEQVVPLAKALEAMLTGDGLDGKPIYFVFTKADVHGMESYEIDEQFDRAMSILLGRLENHGCEIRKYAVSAVGWAGEDETEALATLATMGYDRLVKNMAQAFH